MKQEIDLTKITEEKIWRLYCLAVRIAMWEYVPRRLVDIYETATDLVQDCDKHVLTPPHKEE